MHHAIAPKNGFFASSNAIPFITPLKDHNHFVIPHQTQSFNRNIPPKGWIQTPLRRLELKASSRQLGLPLKLHMAINPAIVKVA